MIEREQGLTKYLGYLRKLNEFTEDHPECMMMCTVEMPMGVPPPPLPRGRIPYRDPRPPGYNNGKIHMDHVDAKVWGNQGVAERELAAETNMRRGGFDGALRQEYNEMVQQMEQSGMSKAEAEIMARRALESEINALKDSPPPRPMDPRVLDELPGMPPDDFPPDF